MTLADRIEALTDDDVLELLHPPFFVDRIYASGEWAVRDLQNTDEEGEFEVVFRTTHESAAYVEARRRNAAHVRERLRGLMDCPAT